MRFILQCACGNDDFDCEGIGAGTTSFKYVCTKCGKETDIEDTEDYTLVAANYTIID